MIPSLPCLTVDRCRVCGLVGYLLFLEKYITVYTLLSLFFSMEEYPQSPPNQTHILFENFEEFHQPSPAITMEK